MAHNKRQKEVERYFLTSLRANTFDTLSHKSEKLPKDVPVIPSTISRVYWSPTHGHRKAMLPRAHTELPLTAGSSDESVDDTPDDESEDSVQVNKILHFPKLPAFDAYRLADHRLVSATYSPQEHDEQMILKGLLGPMSSPQLPVINIVEADVDGVIRSPDIKYHEYRCRKESIERTAKENWILMQENRDTKKRHERNWRELKIFSEKQS